MQHGRTIKRLLLGVLFLGVTAATFSGPDRGPDARYYDYDEVQLRLNTWAALYSDIFEKEIIGHSLVGGEPIWAAKISDNVHESEPEARVFIHAAQHANECNGTNAIIFMMERLLTRYGSQDYYTDMVDNLEMWFVPIVNVDGSRIVFSGLGQWEWWRKTKRDNNSDGLYSYPIDGVDLNRNWDYRWAQYDSTQWWSTRYKGPSPFSEPEAVALRDLILREMPVFILDMHSPDVPSIGNKIWWPWFDPNSWQYGPDDDIYQPICQALAGRWQTETTGSYMNGFNPCYNTLPKEQCWVYAETGICILLAEISRQYWWTGAMIDTIAARSGRGSFYLMEHAQSGPGLTGFVTAAHTGAPLEAEIRVQQVHDASIGPRMTEPRYGQYWRLLRPGSYTVSCYADNFYSQTQSIYVSSTGWTTLNFQLNPYPQGADDTGAAGEGRRLWCDSPLRTGGRVCFRLPTETDARLDLLDVTGRHVATILDGRLSAGSHTAVLQHDVAAGGYLLRLRAGGEDVAQKVMVVE